MAVQTIELAINVETNTGGPNIDIFECTTSSFCLSQSEVNFALCPVSVEGLS